MLILKLGKLPQKVLIQPLKDSLEYIRQLLVASSGTIQLYYKLDAQLAHFEFDKNIEGKRTKAEF